MKNFKKFLREHREAFTLAEVVIVMAILSIMMVAFAPVVTKKTTSTTDTFRTFQRTTGNHGIYYGSREDTKPVVIGDNRLLNNTSNLRPKLAIIATNEGSNITPHILFATRKNGADPALQDQIRYAGQLLVTNGAPMGASQSASTSSAAFLGLPAFANPPDDPSGGTVILGGSHDVKYSTDIGTTDMTIIGGNACADVTSSGINGLTCVGANAGKDTALGTGTVLVGKNAGKNSQVGANTVLIGNNAGYNSTKYDLSNGSGIVCIGNETGKDAKLGTNAVLIGNGAGSGSITGTADEGLHNSVFIGNEAGKNAKQATNTINIGTQAGAGVTGSSNFSISIGYQAGYGISDSHFYSVAIGNNAKAKANKVIAIGDNAGAQKSAHNENSIFLGGNYDITHSNVYIGNKPANKWLCLALGGSWTNAGGGLAGYGDYFCKWQPAQVNVSFGEHIQLALLTDGGAVIPSDEKLKNVGKPFTEGLKLINQIEPVNFTYKRDENKFPHVGVIAQDLMKIFPNAVKENKDGYLYIRTEDMFYAAINAIKELYQMFLDHDKKITKLEEQNAVLEQQNKELKELYAELNKRVEKLEKRKAKNVE